MESDGSKAGLPPTADVAATPVALYLTVREARRVLAGDRRARPWFASFLICAAVLTIIGVNAMSNPPPAR